MTVTTSCSEGTVSPSPVTPFELERQSDMDLCRDLFEPKQSENYLVLSDFVKPPKGSTYVEKLSDKMEDFWSDNIDKNMEVKRHLGFLYHEIDRSTEDDTIQRMLEAAEEILFDENDDQTQLDRCYEYFLRLSRRLTHIQDMYLNIDPYGSNTSPFQSQMRSQKPKEMKKKRSPIWYEYQIPGMEYRSGDDLLTQYNTFLEPVSYSPNLNHQSEWTRDLNNVRLNEKFDLSFCYVGVKFLRDYTVSKSQEKRLRDIAPYVLATTEFSVDNMRLGFRNFNLLLYSLQWYSSVEMPLCFSHLDKFFRKGYTLQNYKAAHTVSKKRRTDALYYWMYNYKFFLKLFCGKRKNIVTDRVDSYWNEVSRLNVAQQKCKTSSSFISQMFGASGIINGVKESVQTAVDNVLWSQISHFFKSIPGKLVSFGKDFIAKGTSILSDVCTWLSELFHSIKESITEFFSGFEMDKTKVSLFLSALALFLVLIGLYIYRTQVVEHYHLVKLSFVMFCHKCGLKTKPDTVTQMDGIFNSFQSQDMTALISVLGTMAGIAMACTSKEASMAANGAVNFASRVPTVYANIESALTDVIDWMYFKYTTYTSESGEGEHFFASRKLMDEFEAFQNDVSIVCEPRIETIMISNLTAAAKIAELDKRRQILQASSSQYRGLSHAFSNNLAKAFATVQRLHAICVEQADYYKSRIETALLWLHGMPGQGKTTVLEYLAAAIHAKLRVQFPEIFDHVFGRGDIHTRDKNSDFWEGYSRQFAVFWNEAFEKRDASERARTASELLTACEDGITPLNMAFGEKGKAFFGSYLAMVTSNLSDEQLMIGAGLTSPDALVRRRTLYLEVRRDQVFNKEMHNFDESWKFILAYPNETSFQEAFRLGTPPEYLEKVDAEGSVVLRFSDVVKIMSDVIAQRMTTRQDKTTFLREFDFASYVDSRPSGVAPLSEEDIARTKKYEEARKSFKCNKSNRKEKEEKEGDKPPPRKNQKSKKKKDVPMDTTTVVDKPERKRKFDPKKVYLEQKSVSELVRSTGVEIGPPIDFDAPLPPPPNLSSLPSFDSQMYVDTRSRVYKHFRTSQEAVSELMRPYFYPSMVAASTADNYGKDTNDAFERPLGRDGHPYSLPMNPVPEDLITEAIASREIYKPRGDYKYLDNDVVSVLAYIGESADPQTRFVLLRFYKWAMTARRYKYRDQLLQLICRKIKGILKPYKFNPDLNLSTAAIATFITQPPAFERIPICYQTDQYYMYKAFYQCIDRTSRDIVSEVEQSCVTDLAYKFTIIVHKVDSVDMVSLSFLCPKRQLKKLQAHLKYKVLPPKHHFTINDLRALRSNFDDFILCTAWPFFTRWGLVIAGALAWILAIGLGMYFGSKNDAKKEEVVTIPQTELKMPASKFTSFPDTSYMDSQSISKDTPVRLPPGHPGLTSHSLTHGTKPVLPPGKPGLTSHSIGKDTPVRLPPASVGLHSQCKNNSGWAYYALALGPNKTLLEELNCPDPEFYHDCNRAVLFDVIGSPLSLAEEWLNYGPVNLKHVLYANIDEVENWIQSDAYDYFSPELWLLFKKAFQWRTTFVSQSDTGSQIGNIAHHMRTLRIVYENQVIEVEAIMSGHRFITVMHPFSTFGFNFKTISLLNAGVETSVFLSTHVKVTSAPGQRDLCYIDVSNKVFPAQLSLKSKLYANHSDLIKNLRLDTDFSRLSKEILSDGRVLISRITRNGAIKTVSPIIYNSDGIRIDLHNSYMLAGAMGNEGDCGQPYVSVDHTNVAKVVGLHVGRSGNDSYFAPIYQSDFPATFASQAYIPKWLNYTVPLESSRTYTGKYIYLGDVRKKIIPKQTNIIPSPAQGNLAGLPPMYPITSAPALLDNTVWAPPAETPMEKWIHPEVIKPLEKAMKKLGASPARPMADWMIDLVVNYPEIAFQGFFPRYMNMKNIRPWTIREVLFGIPGIWKGLAQDTAIGLDMEWFTKYKSRKEIWNRETGYISPILIQLVEDLCDAVRRGECPKNVVAAMLKDETRDLERVRLGKTRLFCVGSLSHLVWTVMWLGGLVSEMKANRSTSDIAIGTNIHGHDWKNLAKRLQSMVDAKFGGGDYGNYDTSMNSWIGWAFGKACVPKYGFPEGSYEALSIQFACESSLAPLLVCGGQLYWMDYFNSSGGWLTGVVNSFANIFIFNMVFHYLWIQNEHPEKGSELWTRATFVYLWVYGDDNVFASHPKVSSWFNMLTIQPLIYRFFGMNYTTASKGAIEHPFIEWVDLEFLKRRFVIDGSMIRAPLDCDSIYSMLLWIKKPPKDVLPVVTEEEQFLINVEVACQEWFQYGEKEFEEQTAHMKSYLRELGLNWPGKPYSHYNLRWYHANM